MGSPVVARFMSTAIPDGPARHRCQVSVHCPADVVHCVTLAKREERGVACQCCRVKQQPLGKLWCTKQVHSNKSLSTGELVGCNGHMPTAVKIRDKTWNISTVHLTIFFFSSAFVHIQKLLDIPMRCNQD